VFYQHAYILHSHRRAADRSYRKARRASLLKGATDSGERTSLTAWLASSTYQRTQIHESLVELAGCVFGQNLPTGFREPPTTGSVQNVLLKSEQTGEDTVAVRVQRRFWFAAGDADYRSGGVFSNAGQLQQGIHSTGDDTAMPSAYLLCGTMQAASTVIVAQPGPVAQDLLFVRFGKPTYRRESL
jgi:hypothetical protein